MDIPQGDKTQLLQLERWKEVGTPADVGFKTMFRKNEATLAREVSPCHTFSVIIVETFEAHFGFSLCFLIH